MKNECLRDDNRCSLASETFQACLHKNFRFAIHTTRCLIQKHNFEISDNDLRNCYTLKLVF